MFGFERIEEISEIIKSKVLENVQIQTKRSIGPNNLMSCGIFLILMFLTTVFVRFLVSKGEKALGLFVAFFTVSIGAFLLTTRPWSRVNSRLKWFEIIVGAILIILGIYLSIDIFLY